MTTAIATFRFQVFCGECGKELKPMRQSTKKGGVAKYILAVHVCEKKDE